MANLDMKFDMAGEIKKDQENRVKEGLEGLEGVNRVRFDAENNAVIVGYTPGLISVQNIKEAIESQGIDISDKGDD